MLVTKEMLLGAFNGAFTGVTGGIAMFILCHHGKESGGRDASALSYF